tara:strand:- start:2233 stop:2829 length:597 start_codon:yes stop_codon:yes gene_type:complete
MGRAAKTIITTVAVLGGVGVLAYFLRQGKLLKDICVSSTDLAWKTTLLGVATDIQQGNTPSVDLPLNLTLNNDSNIDVTIKNVSFDITWMGSGTALLEGRNLLIGTVESNSETVIKKNSKGYLGLTISLAPLADLTTGEMVILGGDLLPVVGNGIDVMIDGNIKLKASIFETVYYPYTLMMNTSEGLEDADEISGDCE